MTLTPADTLKVGDVIMPPAREVQLWMRRHLAEHGLPDSALELTVREVRESAPDIRGRWLLFITEQSDQWPGHHPAPFKFKARPGTPWPIVRRVSENAHAPSPAELEDLFQPTQEGYTICTRR